jgi:DNA-binding GntR family transcriptional regulator
MSRDTETSTLDRLDLGVVNGPTRTEEVVERIRVAILAGALRPGERIKEQDLAHAVGVSRPTAKLAISALIYEGTLIQEPYKGVRVAETTAAELMDVADVRVSLETQAALRISDSNRVDGVRQLSDALRRYCVVLEMGGGVDAVVSHLEFHETIFRASGSPLLMRIWPLLAARIRLAMAFDMAARHDSQRERDLHQRVIDVIAEGDHERIAAEMKSHIGVSAEEIAALVNQRSSS